MSNLNQRNASLNKKLEKTDLPSAVEVLVKDAQKRRRQVRLLALSLFLDFLLTIGLGYVSIQSHKTAAQAETNRVALTRSCETSNEARANNKLLWDHILELPPATPPTTEQQKQIDDFKDFVNETFAPRDCTKAADGV